MKSYSQNGEDLIIVDYLNKKSINNGFVLDIGANDGLTLSNSRLLIEQGFSALLVEPSSVYSSLEKLYKDNPKVNTLNVAISNYCGEMDFLESGCHTPNGEDVALVSTSLISEANKWIVKGVEFTRTTVEAFTIEKMLDVLKSPIVFDVISIDCEGADEIILKQIDLKALGCKVLCIEWNSSKSLSKEYTNYCEQFGLYEIHRNAENIIFAK